MRRFACAALLVLGLGAPDLRASPLFLPVSSRESVVLPGAAVSFRARPVVADLSLFRGASPPAELELNLFDDLTLTAVLDRIEPAVPDGVVWIGHVKGFERSTVILAVRGSALAGHIMASDEIYSIGCAGVGLHAVYQIDPAAMPRGGEPLRPPIAPAAPAPLRASRATAAPVIDVLVLYTETCRSMNGGTEAMEAAIDLEIEMTNEAYANSGVAQRLNLVHTQEVAYTESKHSYYDLENLQGGWIGDAPALREAFGADCVSMFVWGLDVGGNSYLMDSSRVGPTFAPYAYSVVQRAGTDTNYAFAHELGHNMGCQHDHANAYGAAPAFPYSYGHQEPSGAFHTIMAYDYGCPDPCPVIPYFSSPLVSYRGAPTGVADYADNARTLNNTAPIVAAFSGEAPGSLLDVAVSSATPAAGDPFTVDVVVQPVAQKFDAYGVILGDGGAWSFVLGSPGALRSGVVPLATNVPGLGAPYAGRLLDMPAIPAGAQGAYRVIVGLVPAGARPTGAGDAIPGYVDSEDVTVR